MPLGEACQKLYERMPLPEANFFAIVVAIQQKSGGNLSEALGNLSRVLRDRKKMKAKIQAMTMEAKASAVIIARAAVLRHDPRLHHQPDLHRAALDPSDRPLHDGVLRGVDVDGRLRDAEDDQFRLLRHGPEKWTPVFGSRPCVNKGPCRGRVPDRKAARPEVRREHPRGDRRDGDRHHAGDAAAVGRPAQPPAQVGRARAREDAPARARAARARRQGSAARIAEAVHAAHRQPVQPRQMGRAGRGAREADPGRPSRQRALCGVSVLPHGLAGRRVRGLGALSVLHPEGRAAADDQARRMPVRGLSSACRCRISS